MFEAHLAYILQEPLKIRNFHHAISTECIEFVVCKFTFADIYADDTGSIISSGSAESCLARCYPADNGSVSVLFSHGPCNYLLIVHFRIFKE